MLKTGILNPLINSLLSRTRHTNTLVIADRGFPSWPAVETVDISLTDDIPTVLQALEATRQNFTIGKVWMAKEFLSVNNLETRKKFAAALHGLKVVHMDHAALKKLVPKASGLIRTGDTTQYANMILESA